TKYCNRPNRRPPATNSTANSSSSACTPTRLPCRCCSPPPTSRNCTTPQAPPALPAVVECWAAPETRAASTGPPPRTLLFVGPHRPAGLHTVASIAANGILEPPQPGQALLQAFSLPMTAKQYDESSFR